MTPFWGLTLKWVLEFPDVFILGIETRIAGQRAVNCELGRRLRCDGRMMMFSESLNGAVALEKLTGSQLLKKYPAFYGNRGFITAFTGSPQLVPNLIQINPVHDSARFLRGYVLILSSPIRRSPPRGLLPTGFPHQNLLCSCPPYILHCLCLVEAK